MVIEQCVPSSRINLQNHQSSNPSCIDNYRKKADLLWRYRYKDRTAFEAHHASEHFQAAGKKMKEQDLLAKAPEVKVLGALAGYASK